MTKLSPSQSNPTYHLAPPGFEQEAKLLKKSVAQVARRDQRIKARENEIKNLEALLEADADMKKAANDRLSQQVSTLQAQVTGEEKLKAVFEEFKKYEDDRVEKRCAEMDTRLDADEFTKLSTAGEAAVEEAALYPTKALSLCLNFQDYKESTAYAVLEELPEDVYAINAKFVGWLLSSILVGLQSYHQFHLEQAKDFQWVFLTVGSFLVSLTSIA
ncbi:hypothetical protein Tco_0554629 [Tanacetum coccineum]